ncbi:MAG: MATE family efflux transporter [Clostridia bacterium]
MDLTQGEPKKVLWRYCLPLFGSILFQQLYNIADSFVAGKFIGENALAAVGNSYEITLIYLAFALGCNMGASIIIANFYGAKKFDDAKTAISTSFIMTAVVCLTLTIIGFVAIPSLLRLINIPVEIFNDSLLYIYIYTGGLAFLFFYNLTTGIFAALGDSRTPFIFLSISSLLNIGMNILFVVKFKMGISGVAWATFICQGLSCLLSVIVLIRKLKLIKTGNKLKMFSFTILKKIISIAVPCTLQQSFISVGNVIIQSVVNSFGTSVIAGYSASIKINNFALTSLCMVGTGISNYTAQNLGVKNIQRVKSGFWTGTKFIVIIALVFTIINITIPQYMIQLFINSEKSPQALVVGIKFLRIVSPFYFIISIKLISDGILRGAEKMNAFMVSTLADLATRVTLVFILSKYFASTGIWMAWPASWILGTIASVIFYLYYSKKNFGLKLL